MTAAQALAARRRLLAANATLQRVRLAHEVDRLRGAAHPTVWSGAAHAAGWALRALTLWRAVRAWRASTRASN